MRVKFDFNLSAWIKGLEVEASSLEEAKDKLMKMSVEEIVQEGLVDENDITDLDSEILEETYSVQVSDIKYDIDDDDVADELGFDLFTDKTASDYKERIEKGRALILAKLPSELTLTVTVEKGRELEEVIEDEIVLKTNWTVQDFKYKRLDNEQ